MNTTTAPSQAAAATPQTTPGSSRVLRLLERLPLGQLELHLPGNRLLHLPLHPNPTAQGDMPRATLHVRHPRMFERIQKSGDIGLAESYIDGDWDSPDLPALLRLCIANRTHIEPLVYGHWWGRLAYRLRHLMRRNTRAGSAKNIHAHYDLGNDFYKLWLDPSMNYSAAWFEGGDHQDADLQAAQQAKIRRALREARVTPGARLLEVGCGWGGLAEVAAGEFQAQVTAVTLSREQLQWGQQRIQAAGLTDQAQLSYLDYRDLSRQHAATPFDAIVSIEMFEAVGQAYWAGYFQMLQTCLRPGGYACIQTITIRDDLFQRYQASTDFIQQYIFPGGMLPSRAAFEAEARRAGFEIEQSLAFGPDYAETLRRWRHAFAPQREALEHLGFDERFARIWNFYLAYCEAAFDTGNTDVIQFTLRKALP